MRCAIPGIKALGIGLLVAAAGLVAGSPSSSSDASLKKDTPPVVPVDSISASSRGAPASPDGREELLKRLDDQIEVSRRARLNADPSLLAAVFVGPALAEQWQEALQQKLSGSTSERISLDAGNVVLQGEDRAVVQTSERWRITIRDARGGEMLDVREEVREQIYQFVRMPGGPWYIERLETINVR